MKLSIKIFHNVFFIKLFTRIKYILFLLFYLNIYISLADNEKLSILDRLPTSIFATVNGEAISIYDLILRSNLFSVSSKIEIDEDFKINILPELISGLIDEKIKAQEIKNYNIFVPNEQVKLSIQKIEQDNSMEKGFLKKFLEDNDSDIRILEKLIETDLGWRQLIANKFRNQIIIQELEIERVHNSLKNNLGKNEFFIEQIFLSFENKKKEQVLKRIKNLNDQIKKGADFLSVAKQFSDSYSGKKGQIGWMTETDLELDIYNKIKEMKIDDISEPIEGDKGYYLIRIKLKRIIGEEIINKVSLFRINLIENNEKNISQLKEINNCSKLEEFSKSYGTSESGSLGSINYSELPKNLQQEIRKLEKNEISNEVETNSGNFRLMICDIEKIKPTIPSKFKIEEILVSKKLDTISRQYLSELRARSVIDVKI